MKGREFVMSYSIVRVEKIKGKNNTKGVQKHVQRENERYENRDIEHDKTYLNYDLVNENRIDFNEKIDAIIEQNYNGKRKIRTDAIRHIDGIITSDSEFFENKSSDDIRAFFSDAKDFLDKEYGESNLVYATVHMDEKTPHMHFGAVPLTEDGRLSAREVIGNKKDLTKFQDRFNEHVNNKGHDLERGISKHKTDAQHKHAEKYKNDTKRLKAEKVETKQALSKVKQNGRTELEKLNNAKLELANLQEQVEKLRKDKEEEAFYKTKYKQMTKILEERPSDRFEYEYKKPSIFSKEEEKTGKIIIHPDEFDKIKEQARLGRIMNDRYEFLESGEINRANKKLGVENKELRDENKDLKKTNEKFEKICTGACKAIKHHFGDKVYHTGLKFLDDKVGEKGKLLFRKITTVDEKDVAFYERLDEDKRQKEKQETEKHYNPYTVERNMNLTPRDVTRDKDKGFDLDR